MQFKNLALLAAAVGTAVAQRPSNESICDYYTTALLKTNNATNQYTLLTLVVNTAVIGNYTMPNVGIAVPGILAPGMYNGTKVNLLPYFDGGFASSNRGGSSGVAVNFLDDGGAVPLMMNMPSNGTSSAQYRLLTHLYEYFGALLGCSQAGMTGFPAYSGDQSMYQTHKFMALNSAEVGYFITQVGMSAASFGVATADVTIVGNTLNKVFGYRCAPAAQPLPYQPADLQSICIASDCPVAPNSTCSSYAAVVSPAVANSTLVGNMTSTSSGSMSGSTTSSTASPSTSAYKGAAAQTQVGLAGLLVGAAAVVFAL